MKPTPTLQERLRATANTLRLQADLASRVAATYAPQAAEWAAQLRQAPRDDNLAAMVRYQQEQLQLARSLNRDADDAEQAADQLDALHAARSRTLTDHQRLLFREDVEGHCPHVQDCFEYNHAVRCGPCAISQSAALDVDVDTSLCGHPQQQRLERENKALQKTIDRLHREAEQARARLVQTLANFQERT